MNHTEFEKEKPNENETDPRLRFDAFMGGVKDGGLRSVSSIYLIVCYIVGNIDGKVTAENIIQTMNEGMIANHFEVSDAIAKLKQSGVLVENEDGALHISDKTKANIDLIEKDLPYTVRERSMHLCQKIIAKETYRRENKVEISQEGNAYTVTLHIADKDTEFMTLRLHASTIDQAEMIKEKFVSDPVKVYETLIETIFSNEE